MNSELPNKYQYVSEQIQVSSWSKQYQN